MEDFRDNQEADVETNLAQHIPYKPSAQWLHWKFVARTVRQLWLLVGPKLRERLEHFCVSGCRHSTLELPVETLRKAPHEVGPRTAACSVTSRR
eukprot:3696105-Amphidinium_carterae.1